MYLIGYDIKNAKRIRKIHRYLTRHSMPIQYSVFLYIGSEQSLQKHIQNMLQLIDQKEDDLRIYEIPEHGKQYRLGQPVLPEGIYWTDCPIALR